MNSDSESKKVAISNKVMMTITFIMALIYFAFGSWLIFSAIPLFNLSLKNQKILGAMFILYSFYRGYVFYARYYKRKKFDPKDSD